MYWLFLACISLYMLLYFDVAVFAIYAQSENLSLSLICDLWMVWDID